MKMKYNMKSIDCKNLKCGYGEDKLERQGDKWTGIWDSEGKEDANRCNKK